MQVILRASPKLLLVEDWHQGFDVHTELLAELFMPKSNQPGAGFRFGLEVTEPDELKGRRE